MLPAEVVERIAAGEVVERPSSVVRELLDNAIDAGAREVQIDVRGGGLELIRVSDDGWGIPANQVELAFVRHATSKLRAAEELFVLRSLGFRGEALPSIAAVAEVSLLTRADDDEVGTLVTLQGGEVTRRARSARQRGTSVTVRHLFHTVPARLKFLTSGRGESLLVGQIVRRYALTHPDVRFTLLLDGRPSFQSSGGGDAELALREVYGAELSGALISLRAEEQGGATLSGFISDRGVTRPGRQHLHLVVNGRWAVTRGLLAALEAAYRPLLPRGRHPIAMLRLEIPGGELDPNVHPAKTEVRLVRESQVAELVASTVREALARTPARPFDSDDFSLAPRQYRLPVPSRRIAEAPAFPNWPGEDEARPSPRADLEHGVIVGQLHDSLLLVEAQSGLLLVDQHRASERIVYESLLRNPVKDDVQGQSLLEPVLVELKPHQAELLEARLDSMEALGFHCQRFGGRDFLVRAVPVLAGPESVLDSLQALLEDASSEEDRWRERLLASLACRAAIRRNRRLEAATMRDLLSRLAQTTAPAACPHGSPLILQFSGRFLERQFGW